MDYHKLVFAVVRRIPAGRLTNYGAIADFLALGSSRMVGWALNNCSLGDGIPAHRVLNRKGELSGCLHFGPGVMQKLLEAEGVEVIDDRAVDFKARFWDPVIELGDDFEP